MGVGRGFCGGDDRSTVWDFKRNAVVSCEEGMIPGDADDPPPEPTIGNASEDEDEANLHHTEPRLRDTGQRRGASIRRVSWQPTVMSAGKESKQWFFRTLEGQTESPGREFALVTPLRKKFRNVQRSRPRSALAIIIKCRECTTD